MVERGSLVEKRFSYDAIVSNGKRRMPSSVLKHEDDVLKRHDRRKMSGSARDLHRNFSLVKWAVDKHLDYVSQFDFQMRTTDDTLNAEIEEVMRVWQRPNNCDAAGRHPFAKMLRLFEARRTIDGDVFALKLSNSRLQAIEAELVSNPNEMPNDQQWYNGVRVNRMGRALEYGLHRRAQSGGTEFVRSVPASNMCHHGFFERFDQVRGVSPLAAAMNSFRDVYEGIDYALAKMKVEQLFALTFYRDGDASLGDVTGDGDDRSGYEVDFGKGPVLLDLDPGDKAEFLKTDNPGSNTREFLHTVIGIALKALDIPFNFYDESHTNFFGSRAAWLLYDRSCIAKRASVMEFLRQITTWLLQNWIIDGLVTLPRGMTISQLAFEWVPRGMPWWDPAKEITGNLKAMGAGLDNPYRICKETGRGEFEENVDLIAKAQAYAASKGVQLRLTDVPMADVASPPITDEDE